MRALAVILLAACGGDSLGPQAGLDANDSCTVFVTFDPAAPNTGDTVRATAMVTSITGLPAFHWMISHDEDGSSVDSVPQLNGFAVDFVAASPGTYDAIVDLTMTSKLCPTGFAKVNVTNPNATNTPYRLRVLASGVPAQEKNIQIPTGVPSFAFGGDDLSPGNAITGMVQTGTTPVPAYIRITPTPSPDEIVEAFSNASGAFGATVTSDAQTVLVIPASPALAPRAFPANFSTTQAQVFQVDAGTAISGIVKGPTGIGLGGAQVQLTVAGVPSTLAATANDGSFVVQAVTPSPNANVAVAVDVTPPASSGLPRFTAVGAFDATMPFAINYAAITTRDLVGVHVTRAGANVPNATVTLVGTVSNAGTVIVNGAMATATGAIHVAATTDATGALTSLKAPALGMSAVVEVAAGDLAVVGLNLTSGVPATIVAPATISASPHVNDASMHALAGVTVDAVPVGDLALAGAQPIRKISDATGAVAFSLANGGMYDVRIHDVQARGAPVVMAGLAAANVPAMFAMPPATIVTGSVEVNGLGPAANAVVQLLCMSCGGVERTRPIVEVTTDGAGNYHYAVVELP